MRRVSLIYIQLRSVAGSTVLGDVGRRCSHEVVESYACRWERSDERRQDHDEAQHRPTELKQITPSPPAPPVGVCGHRKLESFESLLGARW
jgi:hypothetical protein